MTGSPSVVSFLLQRSAPPDGQSLTGESALHRACRYGRQECVRCLVEGGASATLRNHRRETPMDVAGRVTEAKGRPKAAWKGAVRTQLLLSAPHLKVRMKRNNARLLLSAR